MKSKVAAEEFPELVTTASVPGKLVVTEPTETVAADPVAPSTPLFPLGIVNCKLV